MRCEFKPHAGEFEDDQFWLRDDGEWIHQFEPLHTAKGRLVLDSPDAAWRDDEGLRSDRNE